MITFSGKITGKSEDFFWNKKSLKEKLILWIGGLSFLLSIPAMSGIVGLNKSLIILVPISILAIVASFTIPKNKKKSEAKNELPYKITIDEEHIIYQSFTKNEKIKIQFVKKVMDYGEFYYITFDKSENVFVCQKELLIEGNLKTFEALFIDKLHQIT